MVELRVRELKARPSEIVRSVRNSRARYIVTDRGRPVGMLMLLDDARPAVPSPGEEPGETDWETLNRLGEEIGQGWQSPLTGTELLSGMRR